MDPLYAWPESCRPPTQSCNAPNALLRVALGTRSLCLWNPLWNRGRLALPAHPVVHNFQCTFAVLNYVRNVQWIFLLKIKLVNIFPQTLEKLSFDSLSLPLTYRDVPLNNMFLPVKPGCAWDPQRNRGSRNKAERNRNGWFLDLTAKND